MTKSEEINAILDKIAKFEQANEALKESNDTLRKSLPKGAEELVMVNANLEQTINDKNNEIEKHEQELSKIKALTEDIEQNIEIEKKHQTELNLSIKTKQNDIAKLTQLLSNLSQPQNTSGLKFELQKENAAENIFLQKWIQIWEEHDQKPNQSANFLETDTFKKLCKALMEITPNEPNFKLWSELSYWMDCENPEKRYGKLLMNELLYVFSTSAEEFERLHNDAEASNNALLSGHINWVDKWKETFFKKTFFPKENFDLIATRVKILNKFIGASIDYHERRMEGYKTYPKIFDENDIKNNKDFSQRHAETLPDVLRLLKAVASAPITNVVDKNGNIVAKMAKTTMK